MSVESPAISRRIIYLIRGKKKFEKISLHEGETCIDNQNKKENFQRKKTDYMHDMKS